MSASLVHFDQRENIEEFYHRTPVEVVTCSTANIDLSTLANGSIINNITLTTNDLLLVKNQTNAEENGIYKIGTVGLGGGAGETERAPGAQTADELNNYVAWTGEGKPEVTASVDRRQFFYQTATIINVDVDVQTWSTTPNNFTFKVPGGITKLKVAGCGAGGGGGAAASYSSSNAPGTQSIGSDPGGGGAGAPVVEFTLDVIPGDTLTVYIGKYNRGGVMNTYSPGLNVPAQNNMYFPVKGEDTTITGTGVNTILTGAQSGAARCGILTDDFTALGGVLVDNLAHYTGTPGIDSGVSDGTAAAYSAAATIRTPYESDLPSGATVVNLSVYAGGGPGGNSFGKGGEPTNSTVSGSSWEGAPAFDNKSNGQGFGAGGAGSTSGHQTSVTNIGGRKGCDGGYGYCGYLRFEW